VVSQHQQLLRADFETDPESIDQDRLANEVRVRSASSTVVILSDYGKGTLQDPQALIAIARSNDVRVVVDPKGRDFAKYHGAYLLTPNLAEFEAVAGGCNGEQDLEARARRLCEQEKIAAILITRGAHGLSLIPVDGAAVHLRTDARDVFDVTGAGDTVCAVIGTALAVGMGVRDALTLANTAAGIVVGKLGTATVSSEELASALSRLPRSAVGLIAEPELLACVREARQRGERIVMTNGCFDILHAGHVTYLQQAAALGDRLVVAINSDASVRRLKGADRPINRLADRATVLGGLAALDWVVAFDADTPEELIAKIQPDVLVKGGDYRIEEIAGAESVLAGGGEVRTLPIVAGLSTSTILAAGAGEHGGGDA
jgi:D-beta-D-heptose 7-phosphate kinase/D-beta-D-heptose 1-phosphate adenosyltransferase